MASEVMRIIYYSCFQLMLLANSVKETLDEILNGITVIYSAINYDEKDPFLCNACGYCKYAKFDFTLTSRPCCAVDPIENEDDRKKVRVTTVKFFVKIAVIAQFKLRCYLTLLMFQFSFVSLTIYSCMFFFSWP